VNLLVDELPDSVEIDGEIYLLNTDFRNCLNVILAYEDTDLTDNEKYTILLTNLYPVIPENIEAAIEKALIFLDEGKVPSSGKGDSKPRVYSWSKDANMIYSAFKQTHNIDLSVEKMHWWKFVALFMDLGSNTSFSSIVNLRSRVKSGKATKEEMAAASELGEMFDLPETDTMSYEDSEKRNEFYSNIKGSTLRNVR